MYVLLSVHMVRERIVIVDGTRMKGCRMYYVLLNKQKRSFVTV